MVKIEKTKFHSLTEKKERNNAQYGKEHSIQKDIRKDFMIKLLRITM